MSIFCCDSTDFVDNEFVVDRGKIQFDFIKLARLTFCGETFARFGAANPASFAPKSPT